MKKTKKPRLSKILAKKKPWAKSGFWQSIHVFGQRSSAAMESGAAARVCSGREGRWRLRVGARKHELDWRFLRSLGQTGISRSLKPNCKRCFPGRVLKRVVVPCKQPGTRASVKALNAYVQEGESRLFGHFHARAYRS